MTEIVRPFQRPANRSRPKPRHKHRMSRLGPVHEATIRALDITVALVAIVVFGPLLLLLVVLVKWTSRGPALFKQSRVGQRKHSFTLLKLRTMYIDTDDTIHRAYVTELLTADQPKAGGERGLFKLEGDPRVTPVGRWLRRSSMDELPQLFNVLRGDMSLVGPRPVLAWEAELLPPQHQLRFEVKPGMTGLWQVSGRSKLSMRQAFDLDAEYVQRRSFLMDMTILMRTVPSLLKDGAA
jgi:lipopolysaccharide/colanic/teichoic acid biosynthesis glycosyltransferase